LTHIERDFVAEPAKLILGDKKCSESFCQQRTSASELVGKVIKA
jgi:hypothetical protein